MIQMVCKIRELLVSSVGLQSPVLASHMASLTQVIHLPGFYKGQDSSFLQTTIPFSESHILRDPGIQKRF